MGLGAKVAILPWGDVIEDFLDPLNLCLEDFTHGMSGGWLFGYAMALRSVGFDACILCVARDVDRPRRFTNPRTGLVTVAIPPTALHRRLRTRGGGGGAEDWRPPPGGPDGLVAALSTPPGQLAAALLAERCTHLLCQEYEYHRFDVASRVARRLGIRTFATAQGGVPPVGWTVRRVRRATVRAADGLISAAASEADRVVRDYGLPASRVARIPNPIDVEEWRPGDRAEARAALGLPADATIAVCHTRIDLRRKGLDVLIEAWRRVAAGAGGRDLRLHLIGTGGDEPALREAIARAPVPGLRWTGYTADRAVMRRELRAADLYVMASRHEGFPVAPLEAMGCGLPVLLTAVSGAVEILPERERSGGLVVPPDDADALAAAMRRLLSDEEERRRLGAAARWRVEAFASVPAVGRRLAGFLLGTGNAPHG